MEIGNTISPINALAGLTGTERGIAAPKTGAHSLAGPGSADSQGQNKATVSGREKKPDQPGTKPAQKSNNPQELSAEEQHQVQKLKARDREVRSHEASHVAAGGPYVRGGVSYTYEKGPDGRSYAVGGEVSIDTSPISNNPQATIRKMQTVRRAALAPADPSGADRSVAGQASANEAKARIDLMKERNEELQTTPEENGGQPTPRPLGYDAGGNETQTNVAAVGNLVDIAG